MPTCLMRNTAGGVVKGTGYLTAQAWASGISGTPVIFRKLGIQRACVGRGWTAPPTSFTPYRGPFAGEYRFVPPHGMGP